MAMSGSDVLCMLYVLTLSKVGQDMLRADGPWSHGETVTDS